MVFFHFYSIFYRRFCKQTVETDQTPHSAASGLGVHYSPTSHKKDARLIWVTKTLIRLPNVQAGLRLCYLQTSKSGFLTLQPF